jgi:transcriptional regulator with XRE-family HTH domain
MEFNEKLRILRKRLGVSPEKLADLCTSDKDNLTISGQYIRRLESGAIKSPTLDTAKVLARGLGISVSVLIDSDELHEDAVKDIDLANFFRTELPKLNEENKNLLRHSINVIREKARQEYNAETNP